MGEPSWGKLKETLLVVVASASRSVSVIGVVLLPFIPTVTLLSSSSDEMLILGTVRDRNFPEEAANGSLTCLFWVVLSPAEIPSALSNSS